MHRTNFASLRRPSIISVQSYSFAYILSDILQITWFAKKANSVKNNLKHIEIISVNTLFHNVFVQRILVIGFNDTAFFKFVSTNEINNFEERTLQFFLSIFNYHHLMFCKQYIKTVRFQDLLIQLMDINHLLSNRCQIDDVTRWIIILSRSALSELSKIIIKIRIITTT